MESVLEYVEKKCTEIENELAKEQKMSFVESKHDIDLYIEFSKTDIFKRHNSSLKIAGELLAYRDIKKKLKEELNKSAGSVGCPHDTTLEITTFGDRSKRQRVFMCVVCGRCLYEDLEQGE